MNIPSSANRRIIYKGDHCSSVVMINCHIPVVMYQIGSHVDEKGFICQFSKSYARVTQIPLVNEVSWF